MLERIEIERLGCSNYCGFFERLEEYYVSRAGSSSWFRNGRLVRRAEELRETLLRADLEALEPNDYRLEILSSDGDQERMWHDCEDLVSTELEISNAFFLYAADLRHGRIDPKTFKPFWVWDDDAVWNAFEDVASDRVKPGDALASLAPEDEEYAFLRSELWRFLEDDARSTSTVANAILASLERRRSVRAQEERVQVMVNIPAFRADVYEAGKKLLSMSVIVGRTDRQTPEFLSEIRRVVLNPVWRVPMRIGRLDILARIQDDSQYLEKQHFRVFSKDGTEVFPGEIDWKSMSAENFSYRLRQEAGPWSAIGRVKLEAPNEYDVFLHGTPSRELFEKNPRAFSSGCVRLEDAFRFAAVLLKEHPDWQEEAIERALQSTETKAIALTRPVTLEIGYWTAEKGEEGRLILHRDLYGRDRKLLQAVERRSRLLERERRRKPERTIRVSGWKASVPWVRGSYP